MRILEPAEITKAGKKTYRNLVTRNRKPITSEFLQNAMPGSKSIVSIFHDLKMIRPPSSYWPESANVYVFKEGDGISFFDVGCGSVTSVDCLFSALKNLKWKQR